MSEALPVVFQVILALSKAAFCRLFATPDLKVGRFCLLGRYFDLPGAHIDAFYMSGRLSSSIDLQRFQSDGRVQGFVDRAKD